MNLEAVHLLVKVFLYLNSKGGGGDMFQWLKSQKITIVVSDICNF